MYDITNRRTFEELNYWIQIVKEVLDKEEVIIGIAANKYDLIERDVSKEEGEQFAKENNCLFYETSAKDHYSIKSVFEGLARAYLEQIEKKVKAFLKKEDIISNPSILIKDKKFEFKKKEYKNGDRYEGNFINDLKEGKGIMKLNNRDEYNGNWLNDKSEGNG